MDELTSDNTIIAKYLLDTRLFIENESFYQYVDLISFARTQIQRFKGDGILSNDDIKKLKTLSDIPVELGQSTQKIYQIIFPNGCCREFLGLTAIAKHFNTTTKKLYTRIKRSVPITDIPALLGCRILETDLKGNPVELQYAQKFYRIEFLNGHFEEYKCMRIIIEQFNTTRATIRNAIKRGFFTGSAPELIGCKISKVSVNC